LRAGWYLSLRARIDLAAADLGPTRLKNIAEPIRVYSLQVGAPAPAKPSKPASLKRRSALAPLSAGFAAVLILAVASGWHLLAGHTVKPADAAHLSIVVLPSTNLSGDASQDYFADGMTENLTTDLSRLSGSFVIARNTAFAFKGKNVDAREIG
jgi:adenylate cyclase